ncbi:MAG TPA: ABC transporter permease, partial [Pilimelia sp.]|nr:ABC transporter permease [Pilimelia sp.]
MIAGTAYKERVRIPAPTVGHHVTDYVARVRGGDTGALPAVLGLIVLCTVFAVLRPAFLTAGNFANLFTQGAAVTLIAMGLIFVLLVGEIDLSAGFASGVCAAVLAVMLSGLGAPWYVACAAAMATGVAIGLTIGGLVTKVGIPSFVVTLAAFLAFQGVVLLLIKGGTNMSIRDEVILAIANRNVPPLLGWLLAAAAVVGYAAVQLRRRAGRAARGLPTDPLAVVAARVAVLALVIGAAVYVLNLERSRNTLIVSLKGVPIVVPLIAVLLVLWTFVLQRTAYGRHVYAVGGSREAARR